LVDVWQPLALLSIFATAMALLGGFAVHRLMRIQ